MAPNRKPSTLLESAKIPEHSLIDRFLRFQFRTPKPPPDLNIQAQSVDNPRIFTPTEEGSGIFGRWIVDENGLPAYEYTFDQHSDSRASYPTTDGRKHTEHWHQVGNERITALASNDGTVQVYFADRGGMFLNKFEAGEDSPATVNTLVAFFAGIALIIARFIAWLSRPRNNAPQPFKAEAAATEDISYNPRNSLPIETLRKVGESNAKAESIPPETTAVLTNQTVQAQTAAPTNKHAYAGGFSYIDDGTEIWATAYRYRPLTAQTKRIFGMGYFQTEMEYRNIRITRRVYAPVGNDPVLLVDIKIENLGITEAHLKHYEYWDINIQQLRLEWLRTAGFGTASDSERRLLNEKFAPLMVGDLTQHSLFFQQKPREDVPPPNEPSSINWYPPMVFLTDLSGQPDGYFTNRTAFFGNGNARQPEAITTRRADMPLPGNAGAMPYCMAMKRDLTIPAHQSQTLRYIYGVADKDEVETLLAQYRVANVESHSVAEGWKKQLAYFSSGEDATLQREMAWHSYNLLSATVYNEFYDLHLIPQGSAYLYLHGADGAPRDQALFAIPSVYLKPELAKDMLKLTMRLTDGQTGQIPYAFAGHGYITNGLNVHTQPSDLDLFFLLAMCEYLTATGDMAFLNEPIAFYTTDETSLVPGNTVLDHIRLALKHLFEVIGLGDNQLLRIGSGDWSDSIVLQSIPSNGLLGIDAYQNSKANGESIPNSQMALYVLPILANILKNDANDIFQFIHDGRLERLQQAVETQWDQNLGGYVRAILRDGLNRQAPIIRFDLEAQIWGLISNSAKDHGHDAALIANIDTQLDTPSLIGALLMPGKPYKMVWPAISQLLTWSYARAGHGELAWRSLNRNTFASHGYEYPAIWYGIWSGPDGINGKDIEHPENDGYTWVSEITPMTDFPVMNANPDSMALMALIRVCGIEPAPGGDGLVIRPLVPRERFVLDLPLIYVEVENGHIRGEYRAQTSGRINLYLYPSANATPKVVSLVFNVGDRVPFDSL